jgi:actin-related protein 7
MMDTTAVLDLGSETVKVGYAAGVPGESEPRAVLPSCVRAQDNTACWAVHQGQPTNWDAVETILYEAFYSRLGWGIGHEGNLVLVEPLLLPKPEREQLIQLMFETFNCSGLYIQDAAALSLFAVGKQAGITADIGHGKIDIASVVEGVTSAATAIRLDYSGADLTQHFQHALAQQHQQQPQQQPSPAQAQALKCLVSKAATSAAAYKGLVEADSSSGGGAAAAASSKPQQQQQQAAGEQPVTRWSAPESYTLPDGSSFSVACSTAHAVAEALLDPSLLGLQAPGLAHAITDAVVAHPEAVIRKVLLENIHLVGGGATMPGLGTRVLTEVRELTNGNFTPNLTPVPEYMPRATTKYAAWLGGAVVAKVVAAQDQFLGKGEYQELGPAGVYRKCL